VQLETLYLDRTQGRAPVPELEQDLVRFHGFALKAETATERMEVQRALDVWRNRLEQKLRTEAGSASSSAGQPAYPPMVWAAPAPSTPSSNERPAVLSPSKTTRERVQELQLGLTKEIDGSEQWLRAKVGDLANGSQALAELQALRTRAGTAATSEERSSIRNELAEWKRLRLGQATGTARRAAG
jgi:hypothetical protein